MTDSRTSIVESLLENLESEYKFLTNDKKELSRIYEEIGEKSKDIQYDYRAACDYKNIMRNRYRNILPNESSRFKSENLSYINANLVKNKYILTQGPLSSYINEFWTMVWDSNADTIVCLTNQYENMRCKFDSYFNDEIQEGYQEFSVKVNNIIKYDECNLIVRSIQLTKYNVIYKSDSIDANETEIVIPDKQLQHSETKLINHIQYTGWPDHGLPADVGDFLKIFQVLDKVTDRKNPLIIHCSAGVGRTGTFTVVLEILDMIKSILASNTKIDIESGKIGIESGKIGIESGKIDIPKLVLDLRQYRENLVQSDEQFEFCYLAVIEGIKMLLSNLKNY
ncbi:protein-tyrosine phosphatase 1 [Tupanvirus deep ocean]|uniref:Protein-tyrosine phosphatase 1 n=2 Tax=Tupanvirus TaxID=2094720 RepID=A0AC62A9L9_9VIRU|nr:protein-tyrosine phosphatase 1 [Tupanvirus deep ocean]QKU34471.1 protein-tyrosine phosphatase 1 [Tupanvirus deep ocean]